MKIKVFFAELRLYLCNFWISHIPSHTIRLFYYKNIMHFEIGKGSSIHIGCQFNKAGSFSMGENSTINQYCRIDNRGGIEIGNNVSVSPYVKLISADHNLFDTQASGRELPILIEDFCFIGADAMILGGCTMHRGAALGAKALLISDAEEDWLYVGVPGKKIKKRNGDYTYQASYKRLFH